jgi:hypothetical protein
MVERELHGLPPTTDLAAVAEFVASTWTVSS